MSELLEGVLGAFAEGGILSRRAPHFVPRSGQTSMAAAVVQAIEGAYPLVVEASTGVGKTFAYLVPALLSGERVLVSTATKTLQDQLFVRDLPWLIDTLGVPVRTALLKGRASYLCLQRMEQARHDASWSTKASLRTLADIEQWARATHTGDLAELPALDERSEVIPWVTSTRENCLGTPCPRFSACHVNLARRQAMAADLVVVNHHLFFADLAVRESGVAELLPSVRIVIFDEAHQLNETGVQFLGHHLSTGQLLDLARDLLALGLQAAPGAADWQQLCAQMEQAARELRLCLGMQPPGAKLPWADAAPEGVDFHEWLEPMQAVQAACEDAAAALDAQSSGALQPAQAGSQALSGLQARTQALAESAQAFLQPCPDSAVRWLEVGAQLRLVESPLVIAKTMQSQLGLPAQGEGQLQTAPLEGTLNEQVAASGHPAREMLGLDDKFATPAMPPVTDPAGKTWIFTSATLGDDARLSWFTEPCGLQGLSEQQVLTIGSPFDYARQAALYVPRDFPPAAHADHPLKVAECAARWASQLGGRTLVLTTSLRSMRSIGDALQGVVGQGGELQLLVQGELPKRLLMERFRAGEGPGRAGCILVACASFWEGTDVPGDALSLLMIDKLPFPPPNDPVAEARSKALKAQGRVAFKDYFLPEAAVALKQGAGRLIRRETDAGVLVVCDGRLATMGYGKRLLRALPPMRRLDSEAALIDALQLLTKNGTKAFPLP